jgi:hypothetical protein
VYLLVALDGHFKGQPLDERLAQMACGELLKRELAPRLVVEALDALKGSFLATDPVQVRSRACAANCRPNRIHTMYAHLESSRKDRQGRCVQALSRVEHPSAA